MLKFPGNSIEVPRYARTAEHIVPEVSSSDRLTSEMHAERLQAKAVWGPCAQLTRGTPDTTPGLIRRLSLELMLGLVVLASSGVASAQTARVDEMVDRALREGREVPVIAHYKDDAAKGRLEKLLTANGKKVRTHVAMKGLSTHAAAAQLKMLADSSDVAYLSYDAPVRAMQSAWEQTLVETDATSTTWSTTSSTLSTTFTTLSTSSSDGTFDTKQLTALVPFSPIDASGSAAARSRYSVTGKGVTVAVIDSGVQPSLDLSMSRIRAFVDFVNGQKKPYDDYGHGTHVAGIVAGNGAQSYGLYTGVAPGANIVALKVLDRWGGGTTSNVLAALDWVLVNYKLHNIRIVNLSLGHPVYAPAGNDPLVQAVENLTKRGIVVVVAAGNFGKLKTGETVYASVTSPGNAPSAVTVGAVHTNGTRVRSDDFVAEFSGRGPTRFDYAMKPDLVAPGYAIVSTAATGSYLLTTYPTISVAPGYMRLNGTSMATPVVAGAAALMLSANPALSAHTVKAVLQYTAQRMGTTDVMTQGAGEVNLAGAVRLAMLINPAAALNTNWLKTEVKPTRADLLFNEIAYWGRATIWHDTMHVGQDVYMKLAQWNDSIIWGFADNIVWSFADNIVWGFDNIVWSFNDAIVWGFTDNNIVWGFADDNIVWTFSTENVVWSFADNIVWSFDDSIVWGFNTDNIVWGFDDSIVWGFDDNIVWGFGSALVGGVQ